MLEMLKSNQDSLPQSIEPVDAGGYHIMTWGCQMSEEDSEQMALYLEQMGFYKVEDASDARIVLLNTCSVRAKPEEKVWSELGRLKEIKKTRPDMIIGVCGCMAQVKSDELLSRCPHVDIIVGTGNISDLPSLISQAINPSDGSHSFLSGEEYISKPSKRAGGIIQLSSLSLPPRRGAVVSDVPARVTERKPKLKAHVPVMYGCDKFCTFCIVPLTRGRERSRPTLDILDEIRLLARNGTKEITLLGQTVNSYGKNLPEGRVPFYKLLEMIDAVPGIERIRFTSPYPRDFTDELIDTLSALPSVCEHIHLPLQVGDDSLLAQMHRGYTLEQFFAIVTKLRKKIPSIAITTDLMLGYPGETDQQFCNTLKIVEEVRFDSAYMFAYSPRPNTKAAEMENQVPHPVKIARLQELISLQNRITCEINASQIGSLAEVLVEGRSLKDARRLSGYSRTFKMVHFSAPKVGADTLTGKTVQVLLKESQLTGFIGEIQKESSD